MIISLCNSGNQFDSSTCACYDKSVLALLAQARFAPNKHTLRKTERKKKCLTSRRNAPRGRGVRAGPLANRALFPLGGE